MTIQQFNNLSTTEKLALTAKAKAIIKRSSGKMGRNTRKLTKLDSFYVSTYLHTHGTDFEASDNIEILLKKYSD